MKKKYKYKFFFSNKVKGKLYLNYFLWANKQGSPSFDYKLVFLVKFYVVIIFFFAKSRWNFEISPCKLRKGYPTSSNIFRMIPLTQDYTQLTV